MRWNSQGYKTTFLIQVLSFYANIEVCVLGGVVNIESFAVKPSDKYYPLFSPSNHCNPAMSMEAMDPHYSVSGPTILLFVLYVVKGRHSHWSFLPIFLNPRRDSTPSACQSMHIKKYFTERLAKHPYMTQCHQYTN